MRMVTGLTQWMVGRHCAKAEDRRYRRIARRRQATVVSILAQAR